MEQTIAVNRNTITEILNILKAMKEELSLVRERLEVAPPYGSDEWWQWSIKKSEEDFKAGRYVSFDTPEKLQKYLDSLK